MKRFVLTVSSCVMVLSWLAVWTTPTRAADDPTSLLDPNASVVAHVNLKQLNVPKLMQALAPVLGKDMSRQLLPVQMTASALVGTLQRAGIHELYISLAIQDLGRQSPAIIVPTSRPDEAQQALSELLDMIPNRPELQFYRQSGWLVLAHPATWRRMTDASRVQPNGMHQHYLAHNDQLVSLTVGFNADLRSSVAAIWPDSLPPEIPISLSPQKMMRDVDAISLTLDVQNQVTLGLYLYCIGAQAAERMAAEVKPQLAPLGIEPDVRERTLQVILDWDRLNNLIRPLVQTGKAAANDSQVSNNMKQVMIAMHNFHQVYQGFPPRISVDTALRPLLSWRVFLLPYLGEQALFDQFQLDEPWDSPHNKALVSKMPAVYADPQAGSDMQGRTRLQVIVAPGSAWSGVEDRLLKLQDITDGTPNTICFVEVPIDQSVFWTQPADFEAPDIATAVARLLGARPTLPAAAYFDGSIRPAARENIPAQLTAQGGELP